MDEFDAFASPPDTKEEDPAADFLAREQTEFAGLEEIGSSEPTQLADAADGTFDALSGGGGGLLGDDDMTSATPVSMTVNDDINESMDQLDQGFGGDTAADLQQEPQENGPPDAYSAILEQDTERGEPEKLRVWREEHQKRLDEKDAAEAQSKEEWREKAKKELDDWYKHHDEQLQKTQQNNREAEEAFISDRDEKNPAQAWEKVTRLCEFNPKNSRCTKDVGRMRSILLQMKQTPLVR